MRCAPPASPYAVDNEDHDRKKRGVKNILRVTIGETREKEQCVAVGEVWPADVTQRMRRTQIRRRVPLIECNVKEKKENSKEPLERRVPLDLLDRKEPTVPMSYGGTI